MNTIDIVKLKLTAVNQEVAIFNCENSITGVIHTVPANTTVIFDGGYVLGQYGCVHMAVHELTSVQIQLHEAEKENGTYAVYKSAFNAGAASSRMH